MKKDEVKVGGRYMARLGTMTTEVQVVRKAKSGWDAVSIATGRPVRIKDAARLTPADAEVEATADQADRAADSGETAAAKPAIRLAVVLASMLSSFLVAGRSIIAGTRLGIGLPWTTQGTKRGSGAYLSTALFRLFTNPQFRRENVP